MHEETKEYLVSTLIFIAIVSVIIAMCMFKWALIIGLIIVGLLLIIFGSISIIEIIKEQLYG